ncbi:hypothetical protein [Clostridium fungisolvens]|uniref:Uncharacterized protein n=1 Tax=Clostridium fungisolvens TaxID=1604897 RepID=A0A6V8SRB4_9CLOT|nr:hypothetical protein [Clostridium fungisolvens]GFP77748.1 hypothetical protein bsdtw1_03919 [Clostridium fungisolvens]
MTNKVVSLNESITIDKDIDMLFEDLTERVELAGCVYNYSPCAIDSCIAVTPVTPCIKNC